MIAELVNTIIKARNAYYNEYPIMSDEEYDKLEEKLRELDPTNLILKKVGAEVVKNKIELYHYMPSLDKVKPESVDKWLEKHPGPYIISDKLDGISVLLSCKDNKNTLATRGNGRIGQDISYLLPYIRIPESILPEYSIRQEIIMSKNNFKLYSDSSANARNFVAGVINRKEIDFDALKLIDFVSYELIYPNLLPIIQLHSLAMDGFDVVKYVYRTKINSKELEELLAERKENSKYQIDGLVITQNIPYERTTDGNPDYSVAFKSLSNMQTSIVKVTGVEWNLSKNGLYKPVILIEPTKLGGVTISRVTGNNYKFIVDNNIGEDALLLISRSGDVIPHVESVLQKAKVLVLPKGTLTLSGVDLIADNFEDIEDVHKKRIASFFEVLEVENMALGIVSLLYDNGYSNIFRILKMKEEDISCIKGLGPIIAKKLVNNIKAKLNVTLPVLMKASNEFGPTLGLTRLQQIYEAYPNILEINNVSDLVALPGISNTIASNFLEGLARFKNILPMLLKCGINIVIQEVKKTTSNKLDGITVVMTGFRDKDLTKLIEENGGIVADTINKKTNILLLKDTNSVSSKTTKAKELGVELLTPTSFRERYGF